MGATSMFSPVFKEVNRKTAVMGIQRPGRSSSLTRKKIQGILWIYLSKTQPPLLGRWAKDQRRKEKREGNIYFLIYLHCDR